MKKRVSRRVGINSSKNNYRLSHCILTLNHYVTPSVLVECDPAMKQFLLYLDERAELGTRFVVQDLDATHLFISPEILPKLQDLRSSLIIMLRREPTRIESDLTDIIEFEEHIKKEAKKKEAALGHPAPQDIEVDIQLTREERLNARIGYHPSPKNPS
ncbi:TTDA [Lepeophtheirus salmonis]|uniref:General transcription and DNA repair factor IIH subunit TFB5 n=1 Tax=Lepeophtheirus salmonis TaxID=72036 RepID=A0A7R8H9Y8_LEPSM|nr:TTDA [Lepeophtheirus salmonis]CAF2956961.1 TTDA [Lepeophtheirus salmonis]